MVCLVPCVPHLCAAGLVTLPFKTVPKRSVEVLPNVSKIKDAVTGPVERRCVRLVCSGSRCWCLRGQWQSINHLC